MPYPLHPFLQVSRTPLPSLLRVFLAMNIVQDGGRLWQTTIQKNSVCRSLRINWSRDCRIYSTVTVTAIILERCQNFIIIVSTISVSGCPSSPITISPVSGSVFSISCFSLNGAGAMIWMPFSPLFTCRLNFFCHA